jgi:hypothetical protein
MLAAVVHARANPSELARVSEFWLHLLQLSMLSFEGLSTCLADNLEWASFDRFPPAFVSPRSRQDANALRYDNGHVRVCECRLHRNLHGGNKTLVMFIESQRHTSPLPHFKFSF